jgi:uncharacterized protein (DUF2062 family)
MRPVVIILASGDASEIDACLRDVSRLTQDVIVVSDASGYGNDLRVGLTHAAESGFSHGITLDVSRHHSPADLPLLFEAIRRHPDAIVTGVRTAPAGTHTFLRRMTRAWGDFWTWVETGRWIHDSTHGYRAYPLSVAELALRSSGYEVDVELLVKAMWAGVAVVEVKLSGEREPSAPPRPMPISDVHRFAVMSWMLGIQRLLLPAPLREMMHRKPFAHLPLWKRIRLIVNDAVRQNCARPGTFAACIGVGVFFGILPIWGFQMLMAATVAHLLGLSKTLVLAASNISFPALLPFILYASLLIGHALHTGHVGGLPRPDQLRPTMRLLVEYISGSIVLAVVASMTAAAIAYVAASSIRALQTRRAAC